MIFNNLTWETEMTNRDALEGVVSRVSEKRLADELQRNRIKRDQEEAIKERERREGEIDKFEPIKKAIIKGIRNNREFGKPYDSVEEGTYEKLINDYFFSSEKFFAMQCFVDPDHMDPYISEIEATTEETSKVVEVPETGEKLSVKENDKVLRFHVVYVTKDFSDEFGFPEVNVTIDINRGDFSYHSDPQNPAFDNLWDALEEIDGGRK